MALVNVKVNNKDYQLACDDGQEQHLFELSQELDLRIQQINSQVGQAPENLLLLLSALMLADEMEEARSEVRSLEREVTKLARALKEEQSVPKAPEETFAILNEVAERIEDVAKRMKME